jgi:hypothetical protein
MRFCVITFSSLCFYGLTSCFLPPGIKIINEDPGISIPANHRTIKNDSDTFGPPGHRQLHTSFNLTHWRTNKSKKD